jgi:hypothetical protein
MFACDGALANAAHGLAIFVSSLMRCVWKAMALLHKYIVHLDLYASNIMWRRELLPGGTVEYAVRIIDWDTVHAPGGHDARQASGDHRGGRGGHAARRRRARPSDPGRVGLGRGLRQRRIARHAAVGRPHGAQRGPPQSMRWYGAKELCGGTLGLAFIVAPSDLLQRCQDNNVEPAAFLDTVWEVLAAQFEQPATAGETLNDIVPNVVVAPGGTGAA